jgi:hypothetical protein
VVRYVDVCGNGSTRHSYVMLKEHMARLVLRTLLQIVLLRSIELIFKSQMMSLFKGTNVPAQMQMRFIEHSKLVQDDDPYVR